MNVPDPTTLALLESYYSSQTDPPARYLESAALIPTGPRKQNEPTDAILLTARLQRKVLNALRAMPVHLRSIIETHFQPKAHPSNIAKAFISPNLARVMAPRANMETPDDALRSLLSRPKEAEEINAISLNILTQAIKAFKEEFND